MNSLSDDSPIQPILKFLSSTFSSRLILAMGGDDGSLIAKLLTAPRWIVALL